MTTTLSPALRPLIAAAVRDAVAELVAESVQEVLGDQAVRDAARPGPPSAASTAPAAAEPVRIASDDDLDRFARHLLTLFENPKNRQDLRSGRLRFRLAPGSEPGPAVATGRVRRVEQGAVTERQVITAAENGERLVLGPRAVLTPLGREKARALGVHTEKER